MEDLIIHEVGLRDGLQMEKKAVPLEEKIHWTENLLGSGVDIIQLGSFVHPKRVPQMAETDALFLHFSDEGRPENVIFSGLVLNEKGLERGMACGVDMFCMGVSASDTHSRKNTGMSSKEAQERVLGMAKEAMQAGKKVQASVQSAFGCGFEGKIDPIRVLDLVEAYIQGGVTTISLADTAGHAQPAQVEALYKSVRELDADVELACHFHNTYGLGLANCFAALQSGVRYFESAFGGLGGCPFTKVPAGNVSTEDMVHSMQRMGLRMDVDLDVLVDVATNVSLFFGRDLPGFILKSGSIVSFQGEAV